MPRACSAFACQLQQMSVASQQMLLAAWPLAPLPFAPLARVLLPHACIHILMVQ
jgi:hypothetical protein